MSQEEWVNVCKTLSVLPCTLYPPNKYSLVLLSVLVWDYCCQSYNLFPVHIPQTFPRSLDYHFLRSAGRVCHPIPENTRILQIFLLPVLLSVLLWRIKREYERISMCGRACACMFVCELSTKPFWVVDSPAVNSGAWGAGEMAPWIRAYLLFVVAISSRPQNSCQTACTCL